MENLRIQEEVFRRSKTDPWCRECLQQIAQYSDAFHAIRGKLTEEEQEQLDLYIGACEDWCESHMFVAFELGRESLMFSREKGESIRQVAKKLGRAPSTISRELRRNPGIYRATVAQKNYHKRRKACVRHKVLHNEELHKMVHFLLGYL